MPLLILLCQARVIYEWVPGTKRWNCTWYKKDSLYQVQMIRLAVGRDFNQLLRFTGINHRTFHKQINGQTIFTSTMISLEQQEGGKTHEQKV